MYNLFNTVRRNYQKYEEGEKEKKKEFQKKQYFYHSSTDISLLRHQCIDELHNVEFLHFNLQKASQIISKQRLELSEGERREARLLYFLYAYMSEFEKEIEEAMNTKVKTDTDDGIPSYTQAFVSHLVHNKSHWNENSNEMIISSKNPKTSGIFNFQECIKVEDIKTIVKALESEFKVLVKKEEVEEEKNISENIEVDKSDKEVVLNEDKAILQEDPSVNTISFNKDDKEKAILLYLVSRLQKKILQGNLQKSKTDKDLILTSEEENSLTSKVSESEAKRILPFQKFLQFQEECIKTDKKTESTYLKELEERVQSLSDEALQTCQSHKERESNLLKEVESLQEHILSQSNTIQAQNQVLKNMQEQLREYQQANQNLLQEYHQLNKQQSRSPVNDMLSRMNFGNNATTINEIGSHPVAGSSNFTINSSPPTNISPYKSINVLPKEPQYNIEETRDNLNFASDSKFLLSKTDIPSEDETKHSLTIGLSFLQHDRLLNSESNSVQDSAVDNNKIEEIERTKDQNESNQDVKSNPPISPTVEGTRKSGVNLDIDQSYDSDIAMDGREIRSNTINTIASTNSIDDSDLQEEEETSSGKIVNWAFLASEAKKAANHFLIL